MTPTAVLWSCLSLVLASPVALAAEGSRPQVTIYNDGFASVKERRKLDLKKGDSELRLTDMTSLLEPDSVVLRDLTNPGSLRVYEQNYEAHPLSADSMLAKSEGQTLEFEQINQATGARSMVQGKVLRVGRQHRADGLFNAYYRDQINMAYTDYIVERDDKIGFGLPGQPLFNALDPGGFLNPTLFWKLSATTAGPREVEISYLTGGLRWEATYNLFAERGDSYGLVGWATLENQTGKDFEPSDVKLVGGDVHRVGEAWANRNRIEPGGFDDDTDTYVPPRRLDEYHLYTLPRPTALRDGETKQTEFFRATNIPARRFYEYEGARPEEEWYRDPYEESYGRKGAHTVATVLEIPNTAKCGLGIPLPKGTVKIYRPDIDGRNEFIGEDEIAHTPKDETVRLRLGKAFDLVGQRRQVRSESDRDARTLDESFEVRLRNHKAEAVRIRVREHLWRSNNWQVVEESQAFDRVDARTIEFQVPVEADSEAVVTYTAHYTL
jgi:hypothetical protein